MTIQRSAAWWNYLSIVCNSNTFNMIATLLLLLTTVTTISRHFNEPEYITDLGK